MAFVVVLLSNFRNLDSASTRCWTAVAPKSWSRLGVREKGTRFLATCKFSNSKPRQFQRHHQRHCRAFLPVHEYPLAAAQRPLAIFPQHHSWSRKDWLSTGISTTLVDSTAHSIACSRLPAAIILSPQVGARFPTCLWQTTDKAPLTAGRYGPQDERCLKGHFAVESYSKTSVLAKSVTQKQLVLVEHVHVEFTVTDMRSRVMHWNQR